MSPISTPDPARVAAERTGQFSLEGDGGAQAPPSPRKRGRPKGSKNKPKDGTPIESAPIRTPEEMEQGAQLCGILAATLWGFSTPFTHRRELTAEEAIRLGKAIDPVLYKYLPGMADWQLEINLVLVIGSIWIATTPPKAEEPTEPATVQ